MRNLTLLLLALLCAGCQSMDVRSTEGIKSMLLLRSQAVSMKEEIQKTDLAEKRDLLRAYADACNINNGWIDGLELDLETQDFFNVSPESYMNHVAGLAATDFVTKANSAIARGSVPATSSAPPSSVPEGVNDLRLEGLDLLSGISIGKEVGDAIAAIVKTIMEQDRVAADEARKRITAQLEKTKWPK